jgi:hypothetical protein
MGGSDSGEEGGPGGVSGFIALAGLASR